MNIDKYFKDGAYIDEDGCHWDTALAFIQGHVLDLCCCGIPGENLKYVGRVLRHVNNLMRVWDDNDSYSYNDWKADGENIGSEQSLYFAYYVLDEKGFMEHGGSVPGWLTAEGIELLEDIEELERRGELG